MGILGITVSIVMSILTVSGLTVDECPYNVPRDEYLKVYGNYCYEFIMYRYTDYKQAELFCSYPEKGHIVTIYDSAHQAWLQDQLKNVYNQTDSIYIGLSVTPIDPVWKWQRDGVAANYTNWASGQPASDSCVVIDPSKNGQWFTYKCKDDLDFNFGRKYICQYGPFDATHTAAPDPFGGDTE